MVYNREKTRGENDIYHLHGCSSRQHVCMYVQQQDVRAVPSNGAGKIHDEADSQLLRVVQADQYGGSNGSENGKRRREGKQRERGGCETASREEREAHPTAPRWAKK